MELVAKELLKLHLEGIAYSGSQQAFFHFASPATATATATARDTVNLIDVHSTGSLITSTSFLVIVVVCRAYLSREGWGLDRTKLPNNLALTCSMS